MAIGEAGSVTTNSPGVNTPITVDLTEPLTDPVIAMTATNNGGHMFTLRITDQTYDSDGNTISFTFIIEEWEYLDGAHPATETINWIAVEEGVHTLPDGRVIEAGRTDTDGVGADSEVTFSADFSGTTPAVLTSVMSENDTTTVDSDPINVDSSGFDIRLQEEEAEANDHASETIGWIAIEPGGDSGSGTVSIVGGVDDNPDTISLGDTFNNAISVTETQTINGGDTATLVIENQTDTTVDVFVEEEQSNDTETNHVNETIGVVTFESGLIPCFTTGTLIDTQWGLKPVDHIAAGDWLKTRDGGLQQVRWVFKRRLGPTHLDANPQHQPILIRAGALGQGLPRRDMLVSPQHRMLLEGWRAELFLGSSEVLVPARGLVNDQGIRVAHGITDVTYFHILMDNHQVLMADGCWTESLHAGQLGKNLLPGAAREELFALFPELRCHDYRFGPTARPVVTVREAKMLM